MMNTQKIAYPLQQFTKTKYMCNRLLRKYDKIPLSFLDKKYLSNDALPTSKHSGFLTALNKAYQSLTLQSNGN